MSTDSPQVPGRSIPFAGAITQKQFSLIQRLLLPWWGTMGMTTLWVVIAALIYAIGDHILMDTPLPETLISLVWATALLVYVWGLMTFTRHRHWRRIKTTQQDITGSIGEAGLEWNTPMTTAKYPWSKIVKVSQHPEMLLIFYNAGCAFYIPKHFFANETAWSEANALTLRQLPAGSKRNQRS